MEENENCSQKVEGYENVSDISDITQGVYTAVLRYQAARREGSGQNKPIPAVITTKQATLHEDQAPIEDSGEGDKEREKNTVTETVLENDLSREKKLAKEEEDQEQEDQEQEDQEQEDQEQEDQEQEDQEQEDQEQEDQEQEDQEQEDQKFRQLWLTDLC